MEHIDWKLVLTIAYNVFYIVYICKVLFGGLTNKRIKPLQYIIIIALLIPFFILQYNGIQHEAELINLVVIATLALVKAIVLGNRKVVEKVDGIWYMHHDKTYLFIWLGIFALKVVATQAIRFISGAAMPLWQAIVYFGLYYLVRTIVIFARNPQMSKDVFRQRLIQPKPKNHKM